MRREMNELVEMGKKLLASNTHSHWAPWKWHTGFLDIRDDWPNKQNGMNVIVDRIHCNLQRIDRFKESALEPGRFESRFIPHFRKLKRFNELFNQDGKISVAKEVSFQEYRAIWEARREGQRGRDVNRRLFETPSKIIDSPLNQLLCLFRQRTFRIPQKEKYDSNLEVF